MAGLTQDPPAQRLGRPANISREERLRRADTPATLIVDGLLAPGGAHRR
ncbi:hypothetical protein [Streptomyces litchfieldiae]|uniref:Uncharacterized protein n=1 Tax=Streptomyces litchfieldiae TaxID=3075543 RepID=A0ABU2MMJ9_9ACTN|nr:hypothetical protein [Streptomyces sp. DSM 44938]MDT0342829.1 hypothetical protein [Streptomyces sp. DSM 44938]